MVAHGFLVFVLAAALWNFGQVGAAPADDAVSSEFTIMGKVGKKHYAISKKPAQYDAASESCKNLRNGRLVVLEHMDEVEFLEAKLKEHSWHHPSGLEIYWIGMVHGKKLWRRLLWRRAGCPVDVSLCANRACGLVLLGGAAWEGRRALCTAKINYNAVYICEFRGSV